MGSGGCHDGDPALADRVLVVTEAMVIGAGSGLVLVPAPSAHAAAGLVLPIQRLPTFSCHTSLLT